MLDSCTEKKIINLFESGMNIKEISEKLNISRTTVRRKVSKKKSDTTINMYNYRKKDSLNNLKKHIDDLGVFEIIGEYKSISESIEVKCKKCGVIKTYNPQHLKYTKNHVCQNCKVKEKEALKEKEKALKASKKEKKQALKQALKQAEKEAKKKEYTCLGCGCTIISGRERKYCSPKCASKLRSKNKELHDKFKGTKIDYSITLKKLIKRDNNTCYICKGKCDENDFYINENGVIICGNNYPSIEHIKPAALGGSHTWDNVKLAHRRCNSLKGVKDFSE